MKPERKEFAHRPRALESDRWFGLTLFAMFVFPVAFVAVCELFLGVAVQRVSQTVVQFFLLLLGTSWIFLGVLLSCKKSLVLLFSIWYGLALIGAHADLTGPPYTGESRGTCYDKQGAYDC
jgi:hypothetical protein